MPYSHEDYVSDIINHFKDKDAFVLAFELVGDAIKPIENEKNKVEDSKFIKLTEHDPEADKYEIYYFASRGDVVDSTCIWSKKGDQFQYTVEGEGNCEKFKETIEKIMN
ncbi:hypothetical protein LPJ55_002454 [Coemansia sp. RSA 990]|nr:hypothetical protein LPJ55_002454 [Coemansia sp. RSA 990]KAJ2648180.1 hypothetical protein IWW40_004158 [Coemansia sp. RSA 1250]